MKKTVKKTSKTKTTKKTKETKPLLDLTKARKSRGYSLDKLGAELGISGSQLDRIEKGQNELSVRRLLEICGVLNVNIDEIIDAPLSGKAANKNCDQTLLGVVIGTILETANKLNITPSSEDISKWSSYVYDEVVSENLNVKQTNELSVQIVKISTKLKA